MYQNSTNGSLLVYGLLFLALSFYSCGSAPFNKQQQRLLAQLDSNQLVMTTFTRQQTNEILRMMIDKLSDPRLSEKAKVWYPKAMQVNDCTKAITTVIKKISTLLDTFTVHQLFTKQEEGRNLYGQLVKYKDGVLATDSSIYMEFATEIMPEISITATNAEKAAGNYIKQNILNLSKKETIALLNKLEQQAALTAYRLTEFCNYRVALGCSLGMEVASVLVSQNSTVFQPGETLTITAGIGSYASKANPKITINGEKLSTDNHAVAYYKMKVNQPKGKYTIPVTIAYIDENGNAMTREAVVEYTIR
jgi:hypothetical protein